MTVTDQTRNPGLSTANGKTPANSDMETTPLQEGGVLNISFLYYSFEIALYSYKNDCKHEFASYYLSISIPFWLIFEP